MSWRSSKGYKSQDPSDKKANHYIWIYSLGSTLQFAQLKIKIKLLESDQNCLRHGSSTTPFFSLCKRNNTTKKHFFFGKLHLLLNSEDLDGIMM